MTPHLDPQTLPASLTRILDVRAPLPLRTMAARGVAPGVKPHEALRVVVLMALRPEEPPVEIAQRTVPAIPERQRNAPLVAEMHPGAS